MATITKTKTSTKVDEILSKPYKLTLHNDDFNSFDWVITCLIKHCNHDPEQANQCSFIVHFNGKCDIKYGYLETLSEIKDKLTQCGLSVTIEKN